MDWMIQTSVSQPCPSSVTALLAGPGLVNTVADDYSLNMDSFIVKDDTDDLFYHSSQSFSYKMLHKNIHRESEE